MVLKAVSTAGEKRLDLQPSVSGGGLIRPK